MSISKKAQIGNNCQIAPTAIIHDNVILGDGSVVEDYCLLGYGARGERAGQNLVIGGNAHIRSHTILYEGSVFGPDLRVGHHTMIREGISAGKNLQIGSFNDIEGEADFGDWVRFHSNVHICRGTTIGDLSWIFPYVVTTNDPIPPSGLCRGPRIEPGSSVCTGSIVLPETHIGVGAFIGAMTRAGGAVPAGALMVGNPGKVVGSVRRLKDKETNKQHPWYQHHNDAYPDEAQPRIRSLLQEVIIACDQLESALSKEK